MVDAYGELLSVENTVAAFSVAIVSSNMSFLVYLSLSPTSTSGSPGTLLAYMMAKMRHSLLSRASECLQIVIQALSMLS